MTTQNNTVHCMVELDKIRSDQNLCIARGEYVGNVSVNRRGKKKNKKKVKSNRNDLYKTQRYRPPLEVVQKQYRGIGGHVSAEQRVMQNNRGGREGGIERCGEPGKSTGDATRYCNGSPPFAENFSRDCFRVCVRSGGSAAKGIWNGAATAT